jgi:hypothetical protein
VLRLELGSRFVDHHSTDWVSGHRIERGYISDISDFLAYWSSPLANAVSPGGGFRLDDAMSSIRQSLNSGPTGFDQFTVQIHLGPGGGRPGADPI